MKIANQKLNFLIRVVLFMTDFSKKVVFNYFIKGQFSYCPLPWMFSRTTVNHRIRRLQEAGLRALLNDETSTFRDMVSKSKVLYISDGCCTYFDIYYFILYLF